MGGCLFDEPSDSHFEVLHSDCREAMRVIPEASIDSIVTDPPYGLSFMGKGWDHGVPGVEFWIEALRVLKPGGHLLAFGGTRTVHRLTCAIEDAGFEIRDCIMWVYGSGFPKSLDVSKAIDKAAGATREFIAHRPAHTASAAWRKAEGRSDRLIAPDITAPATDAAKKWDGWGTALKPAWEPIIVARKPPIGTVAENVIRFGTGAINIDACRVGTTEHTQEEWTKKGASRTTGNTYGKHKPSDTAIPSGRWPANIIHDGSEEVLAGFPETGASKSSNRGNGIGDGFHGSEAEWKTVCGHDDLGGSAARFFYCAKASKSDRGEGNTHPTVKPLSLMQYLCRLVTPPQGKVLDPFCGSGSTGKAAILEGFDFIGVEREAEYVEIARKRIAQAKEESP